MKKIIIFIAITIITSPVFAQSFNFGVSTYGQVENELIVNSTGDQTTLSTYGKLGSNDFIAELAVKNMLKEEGYSVAYDYNPQNTNSQYANIYNQPLPTGVALTELQFAGFEGNPRAVQDVYVLTSEYNTLSSQGQANSISGLQAQAQVLGSSLTVVTNNVTSLTNTVTTQGTSIVNNTNSINQLNNNLTTTNKNVSTLSTTVINQGNNISSLNGEVAVNTSNIAINTSSINVLNNGLNQTNQNVNTVANATIYEQSEIVNNSNNIVNLSNVQQGQQNEINGLNNRVHSLEQAQGIIGGQLRVFDSKKWQINAFVDYSTTRNNVSEVGIRVTFKLGKSYEESRIDELTKKINELLGVKSQKEAEGNVYYTGNGVGIKNRF